MTDQLQELIDIIRFTESISRQIYSRLEDVDIFNNVIDEFRRSPKYTASITLLNENRTKLRIFDVSLKPGLLKRLERATNYSLKMFEIDLDRSSHYQRVIRDGETLQVCVDDLVAELFPKMIASLISKMAGYQDKYSILTPLRRGEEILGALVVSSPYMAEQFIPSVRHFAHDISTALLLAAEQKSRKQVEEHLVWSQKMEMLGRLAGGVAHEFNNILITIKGYAELGLSGMDQGDPKNWNFQNIVKGVDRATRLVDQLLAVARRQDYRPKPINLNTIFTDLKEVLRRIIGETIQLRTSLAADLCSVRADRAKVEQVIINLAINARDAMPDGGKLTIETRNVRQLADDTKIHPHLPPGQYVAFSIVDTGEGMSEEILEHIFEPFFSTKELGRRTGLGLATCYGIVKDQGGDIAVQSVLGKGTTFTVYLSRADE